MSERGTWSDSEGVKRSALIRRDEGRWSNQPPRRFCDECGRLEVCWLFERVKRCAKCSKVANTPTNISAWSHAEYPRGRRNTSQLRPLTPRSY